MLFIHSFRIDFVVCHQQKLQAGRWVTDLDPRVEGGPVGEELHPASLPLARVHHGPLGQTADHFTAEVRPGPHRGGEAYHPVAAHVLLLLLTAGTGLPLGEPRGRLQGQGNGGEAPSRHLPHKPTELRVLPHHPGVADARRKGAPPEGDPREPQPLPAPAGRRDPLAWAAEAHSGGAEAGRVPHHHGRGVHDLENGPRRGGAAAARSPPSRGEGGGWGSLRGAGCPASIGRGRARPPRPPSPSPSSRAPGASVRVRAPRAAPPPTAPTGPAPPAAASA